MINTKEFTKGFFIIAFSLIVIDIIIKAIVIRNLDLGGSFVLIDKFLKIYLTKTGNYFGWQLENRITFTEILRIVYQFLVIILAARIQSIKIHKLYKYSTVLIVFGWLGNLLDRIIFSQGDSLYRYCEYLYVIPINQIKSISTIIILVGWILLVVSVIIKFNELKLIFNKSKS